MWRIRVYHPDRHDSVIHTAISRLRTLLGAQSHWVESLGGAYRLAPGVELSVMHPFDGEGESPTAAAAVPPTTIAPPPPMDPIPTEQESRLQTIERLLVEAPEGLATSAISNALGVSDMTALRDLSSLVDRGIAQRVGQGRSTRYISRGPKEKP